MKNVLDRLRRYTFDDVVTEDIRAYMVTHCNNDEDLSDWLTSAEVVIEQAKEELGLAEKQDYDDGSWKVKLTLAAFVLIALLQTGGLLTICYQLIIS